MKTSLYLSKKQNGQTEFKMKTDVQVVVVDLDKSKDYPLNFFCVLPRTLISSGKHSTAFVKIFGNSSVEVGRKLVQKALRREKDDEYRKELAKPLKALQPALIKKVLKAN